MADHGQPGTDQNGEAAGGVFLAVTFTDESLRERAADLARRLNLPVVSPCERGAGEQAGEGKAFAAFLRLTEERLELVQTGRGSPGPVYVDFLGGSMARRIKQAGKRSLLLARAVGVKQDCPRVLDATAGLGRDAFMLAYLGCPVVAVERSPVLVELLRDGLRRAGASPILKQIIEDRFTLLQGDSAALLRGEEQVRVQGAAPGVICLDPMFPPRRRGSALVKKEMRLVRLAAGEDDPQEAAELFRAAAESGVKRVVVKRHPQAPLLAEGVHHQLRSRTLRFDVYQF